MIRRTLTFCWSVRHQFGKYAVVGLSGVVLDMTSLIILKEVFGWSPVFAVIVNQIVILVFNFSLNKYWTFRDRAMPHKQLIRYLILASFNYFFSVAVMYLFNQLFDLDYRLVRIASIALMVTWNFLLYKYWVYRSCKVIDL